MRKIGSTLFILLTIAIMALGNIGTAFAQDDAVKNFTFTSDATWLTTPYYAAVRGAVNVRAIPTQVGNEEFFTIPAGGSAQVVATYDNNSWVLVRAWNNRGYMGAGWINVHAANLNQVQTLDTPQAPACALTDRGEPVAVNIRFNAGWTHDAMSTTCTLFYEGRQEETNFHHYWVVRDSTAQVTTTVTNETILRNGFMWLLEGGAWIHPTTWAIGRGMSTGNTGQTLRFPPMVSYFAADKQGVMAREGYRWPFVVTLADNTVLDFAYGAFGASSNTVDRCDFTEPRTVSITGIYVSATNSFRSTSVGAEGCLTVILWRLPDNTYQLFGLQDTDENLQYKFVYAAYLMPSAWDDIRIGDFVMDEIIANSAIRRGTEITVEGITGMTTFTR